MPRVLTLDQLRNGRICQRTLRKFKELFGESVEVTEKLAEKHAMDFSFDNGGEYLLTPTGRRQYYTQSNTIKLRFVCGHRYFHDLFNMEHIYPLTTATTLEALTFFDRQGMNPEARAEVRNKLDAMERRVQKLIDKRNKRLRRLNRKQDKELAKLWARIYISEKPQ